MVKLFVALLLVASVPLGGQQVSPPNKPPAYLRQAIRAGDKGDVFAKLKANERARYLHLPVPFPMDKPGLIVMMNIKAKEKDPRALTYLGLLGFEDYSHPKVREEAKGIIKQAAELGSTKAQLKWAQIVWMDLKDAKEAGFWWNHAYEAIEKRAKEGDLDALFKMGHYAPPPGDSEGTLRAYPQELAHSYLIKAAEKGHLEAAGMLGHVGEMTARTEEEQRDAWKWLNVAAEGGDPEAMMSLVQHYSRKKRNPVYFTFVDFDPVKAWQWWDKAWALDGFSGGGGGHRVTTTPQISPSSTETSTHGAEVDFLSALCDLWSGSRFFADN